MHAVQFTCSTYSVLSRKQAGIGWTTARRGYVRVRTPSSPPFCPITSSAPCNRQKIQPATLISHGEIQVLRARSPSKAKSEGHCSRANLWNGDVILVQPRKAVGQAIVGEPAI